MGQGFHMHGLLLSIWFCQASLRALLMTWSETVASSRHTATKLTHYLAYSSTVSICLSVCVRINQCGRCGGWTNWEMPFMPPSFPFGSWCFSHRLNLIGGEWGLLQITTFNSSAIQNIDLKGWTVCQVYKLDSWSKHVWDAPITPLSACCTLLLFLDKANMSREPKLTWAWACLVFIGLFNRGRAHK